MYRSIYILQFHSDQRNFVLNSKHSCSDVHRSPTNQVTRMFIQVWLSFKFSDRTSEQYTTEASGASSQVEMTPRQNK